VIGLAAAAAHSTSVWDQPGTLGFLVVFGMGIILTFLLRSMAKHLRRVRETAAAEAALLESANPAGAVTTPGDGVTAFTAGNAAPPAN
jgi:hypothetical protein